MNLFATNVTARRTAGTLLFPIVILVVLGQALIYGAQRAWSEVKQQIPDVLRYYRQLYTQNHIPTL